MKLWMVGLGLVLTGGAMGASAAQVRELPWSRLKESGSLKGGQPAGEGGDEYVFRNTQAKAASLSVLAIDRPGVAARQFAVAGQVRHEGVEGTGYLGMWVIYADGSHFFSRTLGQAGPMKSLTGAADWRDFLLPFDQTGRSGPGPSRLEVNIVLPGPGTVYLKSLRLVEYGPGEEAVPATAAAAVPMTTPPAAPSSSARPATAALAGNQWWSGRQAGWIGGIAGGLFGCLGAMVGVLGGRTKARRLVFALLGAMVATGLAGLVAGAAALAASQPYEVYYPLLLVGVLLAAIPLGMWRTLRKRYE